MIDKDTTPVAHEPFHDEALFDAVSQGCEESFLITVKKDAIKVFIQMGGQESKLAGTLSKILNDTLSLKSNG